MEELTKEVEILKAESKERIDKKLYKREVAAKEREKMKLSDETCIQILTIVGVILFIFLFAMAMAADSAQNPRYIREEH